MKPILCVAGIHDGCVSIYYENKFYNFELEKVSGIKHHALDVISYEKNTKTINKILEKASEQFGIPNDFSVVLLKEGKTSLHKCFFDKSIIKYDKLINIDHYHHHQAHASCGYFQSSYDKAVVLAYDGGGDDSACVLSTFDNGVLTDFRKLPFFLSSLYRFIGRSLEIFEKTPGLDLAGKVMGLSAKNKEPLNKEHIQMIKNTMFNNGQPKHIWEHIGSKLEDIHELLTFENFTDKANRITIKERPEYYCDLVQKALEEKALELIEEYIIPLAKEHDNNLILSGGTALNILINEKIKRKFPQLNIYVPPNPTDVGIPFGLLAQWLFDQKIITDTFFDITQSNFNILDNTEREHEEVTIDYVVNELRSGKIIGVINGAVEIGPRALGNRSILCDPSYREMKSILNEKVKHREEYRPFAPICRREDVEKYFNTPNYDNLDYMSFAVDVKEKYKKRLPSITHYDGTARVQTITKEQNAFIYELLTKFSGVLLNTSFNVQGKPILNTHEDAFMILDNTQLDSVLIIDNNKLKYFKKK